MGIKKDKLVAKIMPISQENSLKSLLFETILSIVIIVGLIDILSVASGNIVPRYYYITITIILVVVMQLLTIVKKIGKLYYLSSAIVAVVSLIFFKVHTINGILSIYNNILDNIGKKTGLIQDKVALLKDIEKSDYLLAILMISALLSIIILLCVKNHTPLLPILLLIGSLIFLAYLGVVSYVGIVLSVVGLITITYDNISQHKTVGKQTRTYKIKIFTSTFALLLVALLIGNFILPNTSYFWNELKNNSEKIISEKRYGNGLLPQGDFSKVEDFNPSTEIALKVTMQKAQSYYLRGYVGEVYTANGWKDIENEKLYSYADTHKLLHKDNFYAQTQLSTIASIYDESLSINNITIQNIAENSKYAFVPYELLPQDNMLLNNKIINDSAIVSQGIVGKRKYSYNTLENQVKRYTNFSSFLDKEQNSNNEKVDNYLIDETNYNDFVYENYLGIPENIKQKLKDELGSYDTAENKHIYYSTAKENILKWTTSNINYSTRITPFSSGEDLAEDILKGDFNGYSVHYATIATLMFRYYGIPARYVEGYLVTPNDVKNASDNSTLEIDFSHAHCWTEFYQDGVGWIPFETTQPYLNIMESAEDISGNQPNNEEFTPPENNDDKNIPPEVQGEEDVVEIEPEDNTFKIILIVAVSIIAFLLLVVLIFVIISICKNKKWQKLFDSENKGQAVLYLFAYSTEKLLKKKYISNIYCDKDKLEKIFGSEYLSLYNEAFEIFEKAKFSKLDISQDELQKMLQFKDITKIAVKKGAKYEYNKKEEE